MLTSSQTDDVLAETFSLAVCGYCLTGDTQILMSSQAEDVLAKTFSSAVFGYCLTGDR